MVKNRIDLIDKIYQLQLANKNNVRNIPVKDRINLLKKLENEILTNRNQIVEALHLDFRKSKIETESTEIFPVLSEIRLFKNKLNDWAKPKSVSNNLVFFGSDAKIQYEPKGNCLIISPWNYPFQLAIVHLVACVAAGNTAIIKPSEFSPNTNQIIIKIIKNVFKKDHIAVIEGEIEETTHLLSKKFDHIHFTGSPNVGKIVMTAGAKHLSSVTLELGGKSPLVIDDSLSIDTIVSKAMWGKLINNGQTCIAPDYILIKDELLQPFIEAFIKHITKVFNNNPQASHDLARMINLKHFNRVKGLIEDAVAKGATCPYGNEFDVSDLYIKPTLLTNLSLDSTILKEEIFGPVFPIITYKSTEKVITYINQGEKPLALYIFSKKKDFINQITNQTSSGAVLINETLLHIMHPNLPFGGVNNSGIGSSTGWFGFEDFSHAKPILNVNQLFSPTKFLNYPYKSFTQKLIDFMIKYL